MRVILLFVFASLFVCCGKKKNETLFSKLQQSQTGITFRNLLKEDNEQFNIVMYPYFYNGAGVAIGDVNNDGLPDIFFTGNMVKNRLFINKGDFRFEDVTIPSKVAEKEGWCTGTTMVDINEDGWLDIYVCRSGLSNVSLRRNMLFINNHDLTFTESAEKYGLDDSGFSTQASFFDYDKDGDLDMFLINQSTPEYSRAKIEYTQYHKVASDQMLENKLFRNENGMFKNVSAQAGIHSSVLTFSLGISTCDINMDNWPDIYVANDFKEPDYLYINNKDGSFTESLKNSIQHTSLYAMGIDVADYNNDLLPDMVILDMLAENNYAQKMHMGADNFNTYNFLFNNGMYYQYMKNSLQKNNGDGTFSEIGQLAGISNTDWSWSPLLADYNNDGLKDLFITNGYKRDNTSIEFMVYSMNQALHVQKSGDAATVNEYISHMPSIELPNYIYKNSGTDKFENKIKDWGLDQNSLSNGAAYADLDNDGDLDLVTNNIDDYAGIYRNNSEELLKSNYLKIRLNGSKQNSFAIGTKVYAYAGQSKFYIEQNPVRGYQSSSDPVLHLGLGTIQKLDSIRVIWPDDRSQLMTNVNTNQQLKLNIDNARQYTLRKDTFTLLRKSENQIAFTHHENRVNDFTTQFLLPYFYSHNGPCMAQADINGDKLIDLFIGGAKDQPSEIFIQTIDHKFKSLKNPAIEKDAASEDVGSLFFDADGDKDADLYVVSGGYEFEEGSPLLQDRLYLNNGKGQFIKSVTSLPQHHANKSCVASADIDADGDLDLFVGGKVVPGKYPMGEASKIYINDGKGKFIDNTININADIEKVGIINSAIWTDVNKDGRQDLILAGEWMTPKIFVNVNGKLTEQSSKYFASVGSGWWNTILTHDFDKDGDEDLVLGNYGWNSQLKVNEEHPMKLYSQDIDGNGSIDPIITHYIGASAFPLFPRDDMNGQTPMLKKKFSDYGKYANATIQEILSPEQLQNSSVSRVTTLSSVYLENTPNGFVKKELPIEAQYSPVHALTSIDVDHDGDDDLIMAGNNAYNRIYFGRHDANHGMVMLNDGKGNFNYVPQFKSGFDVEGDVRSLIVVGDQVIFGVNNLVVQTYNMH